MNLRTKLQVATTSLSALVSLFAAMSMSDHVRIVDIIILFFGGLGTGAGLMALRFGRQPPSPRSDQG